MRNKNTKLKTSKHTQHYPSKGESTYHPKTKKQKQKQPPPPLKKKKKKRAVTKRGNQMVVARASSGYHELETSPCLVYFAL